MTNKGIFISTPISGFENQSDYLAFRGVVLQLIKRLQERYNVCSEIETVHGKDSYDSPQKSVENDFQSIKNNEAFILLHPTRMQSSSLVEFGYACALDKKIVVVGKRTDFPYLVVGYERYSKDAQIVETDSLCEADFDGICKVIDELLGE